MRGNLILVKHYNFMSWLIRKITKSEYNHIGLLVTDDVVIEAQFGGVTLTHLSEFKEKQNQGKLSYDVYRIKKITEIQKTSMIEAASRELGAKYDFAQFFSLGTMLLTKITRRIEPIDIRHRWICSELVAEAAYEAGIRFHENIDPDSTTPSDIANSPILEKVDD